MLRSEYFRLSGIKYCLRETRVFSREKLSPKIHTITGELYIGTQRMYNPRRLHTFSLSVTNPAGSRIFQQRVSSPEIRFRDQTQILISEKYKQREKRQDNELPRNVDNIPLGYEIQR